MDFQNISHLLNNHSEHYQLIDKAMINGKKALSDLITKDDGSLKYINTLEHKNILYAFNKQSLIFKQLDSIVCLIRTEIGIFHNDSLSNLNRGLPIGIYTLDTTLDGEVIDDSLIEF